MAKDAGSLGEATGCKPSILERVDSPSGTIDKTYSTAIKRGKVEVQEGFDHDADPIHIAVEPDPIADQLTRRTDRGIKREYSRHNLLDQQVATREAQDQQGRLPFPLSE